MNLLSDVMFWRELLTVLALGLFLGISAWAYSVKRQDEFEAVSALLMADDDHPESNAENDHA
ncbi:MAG: hypothetical protein ACK4FF_01425 [Limnobacter sp.]|uniref:hypothetical protein n=1 Tax=Limnobacter sp. TaxID=2003368 RepID=UPI0039197980